MLVCDQLGPAQLGSVEYLLCLLRGSSYQSFQTLGWRVLVMQKEIAKFADEEDAALQKDYVEH